MLSDSEIEELISSYRGVMYSIAKKYHGFPADDLVQEAMISVWKELKKYDGVLPVDLIIKKRASWRMAAITCGQANWTSEFRSSSNYRKVYHVYPNSEEVLPVTDEYASRRMEDVEFTAHRDDIVKAVNKSLTPKQQKYLTMKKMYQYSGKDLKEEFGYVPDNLLSESCKEKLRTELAHLESMVTNA